MALSTFTLLYKHHHPSPEFFHHPKQTLNQVKNNSPIPLNVPATEVPSGVLSGDLNTYSSEAAAVKATSLVYCFRSATIGP